MTSSENTAQYEAPALTVLGSVYDLTETVDKTLGPTDGFTFQGVSITNSSPHR